MDDFAGVLVALLLLCFFVEKGWGVQCYICSWSVRDVANRTDRCTDLGFSPSRVYVHDCEEGCEEFLLADANGILEHWRRSCSQKNGQPDNTCHSRTTPAWRIKRCTCSQDLCNGGGRNPLVAPPSLLGGGVAAVLFGSSALLSSLLLHHS